MSFNLGIAVEPLVVRLYRDADFVSSLTNKDGPWPAGMQMYLYFPQDGVKWLATIFGTEATFNIDSVTANTRASREKVELWVVTEGADQCWAVGTVTRFGD